MVNINEHLEPSRLLKYSFIWTEARLVIAAVALLIGGRPPLTLLPLPYGLMTTFLTLAWILSGATVIYLAYRWYQGGQMIFGGKNSLDLAAFAVALISGINLGIVGISGQNIGMQIAGSYPVFIVTGLLYLAAAAHLYKRYKAHSEQVF